MTERQGQLTPITRASSKSSVAAIRTFGTKSARPRLGVSCSVLFGCMSCNIKTYLSEVTITKVIMNFIIGIIKPNPIMLFAKE